MWKASGLTPRTPSLERTIGSRGTSLGDRVSAYPVLIELYSCEAALLDYPPLFTQLITLSIQGALYFFVLPVNVTHA